MTDSRTEILTRIRQSLPKAYLPSASGHTPPPPTPPDFAESLADVFTRALEDVQGRVRQVENQQAARDLLVAEFRTRGVAQVLGWESLDWLLPGLKEALNAANIEIVPSALSGPERKADLAHLETLAVGLTGAVAGLARTGSIIFHADNYHGRLASLLPPVHYAVLYADRLYPDLAAWLSTSATGPAIVESSNTVIITGPSRTADIAQTLTLGAHGPKELHVVLIKK